MVKNLKRVVADKLGIGVMALTINVLVIFSLPLWYFLSNPNNTAKYSSEQKRLDGVKVNLETPPKKQDKIKPRTQKRETKLELKSDSLSKRFQLDLSVNAGMGAGAALGDGGAKNIIFSQNEVEIDPIRIGGRSPTVPSSFVDLGKNGKVDIEAVIDENGNVVAANSIAEDPRGYGLKESVLSSVKTWKFKPAMINRVPVKVRVIIPFLF